jgi:hypothetical protein
MEHLFSPCTRWLDLAERRGRLAEFKDQHNTEELNLDISTEELCSAERAFTYADLYAMLGNGDTVAWLTPHAAVLRGGGSAMSCTRFVDADYNFKCNADGESIWVMAGSTDELLEICAVLLRLLAASAIHSVDLYSCSSHLGALINAASLAYTMERCQSLKALTLQNLALDEDEIRVLDAYSRPGLDIALVQCKLTSAGASALAEVLGRNQGPTKLDCCDIDNIVLANELRGNSRLTSLTLRLSRNLECADRQALAIAGALKENKGLVDLNLLAFMMNPFMMNHDETWDAVCHSLKTHPTLEVLDLGYDFRGQLAPAVIKSRIQAFVDMLKGNMSIHTIGARERYSEHKLFRESVVPYLETNRLRPRLLAIQRTRPMAYRAKVLGRALLAVRTDMNSFWMLLSGNAEVVFLSMTATTTAATNLPTPATAAVTVTASTRAASTSGALPAADNVAPSAACQKRKATPY